jgi:HPt (histidine-containing phosphotransfer) domain-containing protein
MSPESVLLDPASIAALRELGSPGDPTDFLREIVGIYLADTPARLAELDQALAAGDVARFSRAVHSIKGSSANVGAIAVRTVAGTLEDGSHSSLEGMAEGLALLRREFERTKGALESLTGTAPSSASR